MKNLKAKIEAMTPRQQRTLKYSLLLINSVVSAIPDMKRDNKIRILESKVEAQGKALSAQADINLSVVNTLQQAAKRIEELKGQLESRTGAAGAFVTTGIPKTDTEDAMTRALNNPLLKGYNPGVQVKGDSETFSSADSRISVEVKPGDKVCYASRVPIVNRVFRNTATVVRVVEGDKALVSFMEDTEVKQLVPLSMLVVVKY